MGGTGLSRADDGHETPPRSATLDVLLRHAGAAMAAEHGALVALDYGSPAGEVAMGLRAVGIADRSELPVLEVLAPAGGFESAVEEFTRVRPRLGRAVYLDGWWCPTGPGRLVILCHPGDQVNLAERLSAHPHLTITDITARRAVLSVVGPRADSLMTRAGLATVAGMSLGATLLEDLAGRQALVVRDRSSSYLVSVAVDDAVHVWETLLDVGHPLGVGFLGRDALDRLAVSARMQARQHGPDVPGLSRP